MTKGEFKAWLAHTKGSEHQWQMDPIQFTNHKTMLFYHGGVRGLFIEIDRDGKFFSGTYEDALPHIGKACFKVSFSKQFPSQRDAMLRLIEVGGIAFVRAKQAAEQIIARAN